MAVPVTALVFTSKVTSGEVRMTIPACIKSGRQRGPREMKADAAPGNFYELWRFLLPCSSLYIKNDQPEPALGRRLGATFTRCGDSSHRARVHIEDDQWRGQARSGGGREGGSGQLLRGVAIRLTVLEFTSKMASGEVRHSWWRRIVRLLRTVAHSCRHRKWPVARPSKN